MSWLIKLLIIYFKTMAGKWHKKSHCLKNFGVLHFVIFRDYPILILLNKKRTKDTNCGCCQHQSEKHQGIKTEKERLYIGEWPQLCHRKLWRQQAVLRGCENQATSLDIESCLFPKWNWSSYRQRTKPSKPVGKQNKQTNNKKGSGFHSTASKLC